MLLLDRDYAYSPLRDHPIVSTCLRGCEILLVKLTRLQETDPAGSLCLICSLATGLITKATHRCIHL